MGHIVCPKHFNYIHIVYLVMDTTYRDVFTLHHFDNTGYTQQDPRSVLRPQAARPLWVVSEVELVINDVNGRHPRV